MEVQRPRIIRAEDGTYSVRLTDLLIVDGFSNEGAATAFLIGFIIRLSESRREGTDEKTLELVSLFQGATKQ